MKAFHSCDMTLKISYFIQYLLSNNHMFMQDCQVLGKSLKMYTHKIERTQLCIHLRWICSDKKLLCTCMNDL